MATKDLTDFLRPHYRCKGWTIQNAVMLCATGPYRELLRKAAQAWWLSPDYPDDFNHMLKGIMLHDSEHYPSPPVWPLHRISQRTLYIRRELEDWLQHWNRAHNSKQTDGVTAHG